MLARYQANEQGRDFVCGDIHGGWSLLDRALAACDFDSHRDRLFCVGDLIDRGADSARFPEYLSQPWFHCIAGNHEQLALRAMFEGDSEAEAIWWMNGGGWIMDLNRDEGKALIQQLESLPLAIEIEGFGDEPVVLTHAGLPDDDWPTVRRRLEGTVSICRIEEPVHSLLWDRLRLRRADTSRITGAKHVFHGHTVLDEILCLGNRTYLDLGSVMSGQIGVVDIQRWLNRPPGTRDGLYLGEDDDA
jgi:serine/threonine protein phosphatase 1